MKIHSHAASTVFPVKTSCTNPARGCESEGEMEDEGGETFAPLHDEARGRADVAATAWAGEMYSGKAIVTCSELQRCAED
jgi:hypothetical protein